ncbi:MAG: hypothetical protein IPF66_10105 [Holophagales bacterium]|nr:hypothetical protein [Holophagales bacterium]
MRLNDDVAENRRLTRWADLLPRAPGQRGAIHETDAELVELGDGRLLALTVDTVCEEIRLGLYRDPRTAGRLAAAAALSDLAAVGAEPLGLLLSVTLPAGNADVVQEAVARGVAETASAAGIFVLGGDTNEGNDLSVGCTAAGTVPCGSELRRVGISPGDLLFSAGPLGLGAAVAASTLSPAERCSRSRRWRRHAGSRTASRSAASPRRQWTRATVSSPPSTSSRGSTASRCTSRARPKSSSTRAPSTSRKASPCRPSPSSRRRRASRSSSSPFRRRGSRPSRLPRRGSGGHRFPSAERSPGMGSS